MISIREITVAGDKSRFRFLFSKDLRFMRVILKVI